MAVQANNLGVDAEADAGGVNAKCRRMQQCGMHLSLVSKSTGHLLYSYGFLNFAWLCVMSLSDSNTTI
jgi:hypothetical protein